jgi:hypothetical protein
MQLASRRHKKTKSLQESREIPEGSIAFRDHPATGRRALPAAYFARE